MGNCLRSSSRVDSTLNSQNGTSKLLSQSYLLFNLFDLEKLWLFVFVW
jgi:hypothetical protein